MTQDFVNLGSKRVCVMTDKNIAKLPALKTSLDALTKSGVSFDVYDQVRVEPTDERSVPFIILLKLTILHYSL